MKRSSIYLRDRLSEKELALLTKDLIDHSVDVVSKIKNICFSKDQITAIASSAVNRVLFTYKFGKGGSLGELVKTQVMNDIRLEVTKVHPDLLSRITWPDLVEKKPFERLVDLLQRMQSLDKAMIEEIFDNVNDNLNGRQQKLLNTVYSNTSITYGEVCKQFGTRGVMTYREIKIIYAQLLQTLKFLEVNL